MAIVYKTGQASATGWTEFGLILTLKPARELCYSASEQTCPGLDPGQMVVAVKKARQK